MEFNGSRIEVYCEVEPNEGTKWLVTINFCFNENTKLKTTLYLTLRCFKYDLTEVKISIGTGAIINTDLETKLENFGWVRKKHSF